MRKLRDWLTPDSEPSPALEVGDGLVDLHGASGDGGEVGDAEASTNWDAYG